MPRTVPCFFALLRFPKILRNLLCAGQLGLLSLLFLTPHAHGEQAASTEPLPEQTWETSQRRSNHSATLLGDGTVLVVGGIRKSSSFTSSAEGAAIYDPQSKAWQPVHPPDFLRDSHTATLLGDGAVLIVSGVQERSFCAAPSAEEAAIYDPQSKAWRPIQPPNLSRGSHTATLLPDGRVLIAGGGVGMMLRNMMFLTAPKFMSRAATHGPLSHRCTHPANGIPQRC